MTYAVSGALQAAVYDRLNADTVLTGLVGGAIFDAPKASAPGLGLPRTYVTLGEEVARDFSTQTSRGAQHDFVVSVHSDESGFVGAKAVAGAVCDALIDSPLTLSRGALVGLIFERARARRGASPERRRIDLNFRALVEDN